MEIKEIYVRYYKSTKFCNDLNVPLQIHHITLNVSIDHCNRSSETRSVSMHNILTTILVDGKE